jgi:predicted alpha/beta superfamily hydrolase
MILKFDLYMRSFGANRRIHMYLPDDYLISNKNYPVLYMFDGHNLFNDEDATYGKSWNLAWKAIEMEKDLIIVGQECSHVGDSRLSEYAPFSVYDPDYGYIEGRGKKTMQFFVHDLKPYIDAHFPTLPDRAHTFIGGSSCGGTMALWAGYRYSSIYSKALAISPFINCNAQAFLADIAHTKISRDTSIYFSWGAQEGRGHEFVEETHSITQVANLLLCKGVRLHFNCKPLGHHREADWENEAYDFLNFLL